MREKIKPEMILKTKRSLFDFEFTRKPKIGRFFWAEITIELYSGSFGVQATISRSSYMNGLFFIKLQAAFLSFGLALYREA